jgi:xanthine/uracil permease
VGRITVVVVCVIVLGINAFIFKKAAERPQPLPALQASAVVSLMWMFAGAWGLYTRKNWGRVLMLAILYAGCFGLFLAWIMTLSLDSGPLQGRLAPIVLGMVIYLISSLVLTHSKDVKRLTSRALE